LKKRISDKCPKCGKSGWTFKASVHYAGHECKYCLHHITEYVHIYACAWVPKSRITDIKTKSRVFDEVIAYLESCGYIDKDNRYRLPNFKF
jgi:hypothetical protein